MLNPVKASLTKFLFICLALFCLIDISGCQLRNNSGPLAQSLNNTPFPGQLLRYPNGLTVVHFQHDRTHSAISALVNSGSADDYPGYGGLAHLVEHVVFRGSAAYPAEDALLGFVNRFDGQRLAVTRQHTTHFDLSVSAPMSQQAVHRLADMLANASFNQNDVQAEIAALDAEWRMKQQNDAVAVELIDALSLSSDPQPSQFGWGNHQTLGHHPVADLYRATRDFYHTFYQPHNITLVIVSPLSTAALETALAPLSQLGRKATPSRPSSRQYLKSTPTGRHIRVTSKQLNEELQLRFLVDGDHQDSARYLTSLLNSEHAGGVAAGLRDQGWANSLYAQFDQKYYGDKHLFGIYIDLTSQGMAFKQEIVSQVLNYLEMVAESPLPEIYHQQLQQQFELQQAYFSPPVDLSLSHQMAINVAYGKIRNPWFAHSQPGAFNSEQIRRLLAQMTSKTLRLFDISAHHSQLVKLEPFSQTNYSITALSHQFDLAQRATPKSFSLPPPNRFLAGNWPLHQALPAELTQQNIQNYEVQFVHPTSITQPVGQLTIQLNSALGKQGTQAYLANLILAELIEQQLMSIYEEAIHAGMELHVDINNGVTISLNGLTATQLDVLEVLVRELSQLTLSPAQFNNLKQQLQRNWQAEQQSLLLYQLIPALSRHISADEPSKQALDSGLQTLTSTQVLSHFRAMLEDAKARVLAVGNYTPNQLNQVVEIASVLAPGKTDSLLYRSALRDLSEKSCIIQRVAQQDNALLDVSIAVGDERQQALALMISRLAEPLLYQELRQQQQLGYSLGFVTLRLADAIISGVYAQTPHELTHVRKAINTTLDKLAIELTLHPQRVAQLRAQLISELSAPAQSLQDHIDNLLFNWQYNLAPQPHKTALRQAVNAVSNQDLVDWLQAFIHRQNGPFVEVELLGQNTKSERDDCINNQL